MKINTLRQYVLYSFVAILVVLLTRTIFHFTNNFEFITAFSINAGFYFKNKKFSLLIPFFTAAITDLIIGNSMIYIFTWSAFLIAPLIGYFVSKFKKVSWPQMSLAGGLSTIVFFLWTNFGVVVLTNMYTRDLAGIIKSYINGLPFLQNQIIGNIILVPVLFIIVNYILQLNSRKLDNENSNTRKVSSY